MKGKKLPPPLCLLILFFFLIIVVAKQLISGFKAFVSIQWGGSTYIFFLTHIVKSIHHYMLWADLMLTIGLILRWSVICVSYKREDTSIYIQRTLSRTPIFSVYSSSWICSATVQDWWMNQEGVCFLIWISALRGLVVLSSKGLELRDLYQLVKPPPLSAVKYVWPCSSFLGWS